MSGESSQKFTTFTVGPQNQKPVAQLALTRVSALLGSIIQLDGRKSYDPERTPLNYHWKFAQTPLGSEVETSGFKEIRPRAAAVSFIPDKVGTYVVALTVDDGELTSDPVSASVTIQYSQVPVGENIVPDAQFLWNYISDFWNLVEDREKLTTIWSGIIQELGAEVITLWDHDLNKSLATIQTTKQRRWQRVSMRTDLTPYTDQRIIVGKTDAGLNGRSGNIGQTPGTGNTTVFYVPLGNPGDGDRTDFTNLNGNFGAKGRLLCVNGQGHIIERVANKGLLLSSDTDGATTLGSNILTSTGTIELPTDFIAAGVQAGDRLVIRSGENAGTYLVKTVSTTQVAVAYLADPPGGPVPSFKTGTAQSYAIGRPYSVVFLRNSTLSDGIVGASWRLSHLLHVPGAQFQARGVSAGDVLVLEVTRHDAKISAELRARVVGAAGDRLSFEFTTDDLSEPTNSGSAASVVASGGVVTVSGLSGMRPTSVGSWLEILNGDNPGRYKVVSYVDENTVTIRNPLAVGADSGNPAISWVERGRQGADVERALFRQLVVDLRMVPAQSSDRDIAAMAETLIAYIPPGINLVQRRFSEYKISMRAKTVLHNKAVAIDPTLVSLPALQESPADPPTILLENLDYTIENGTLTFVNKLFSPKAPSPEEFWSELALLDNSDRIEENFGRLVRLNRNDLTAKKTRAPYLSAVKGLVFAYTNGPTVNNLRLGMQILLGLPFTDEKGLILEHQANFTTDSQGKALGRLLIEDLDLNWKPTGNRRVYFYPMSVGLETNPATGNPYNAGDTIEAYAAICKGVDVQDYVKTPMWWERSLFGLEILKYFVFKILIDSSVFDSSDVQFALDFIRSIKPTYTKVIATLVHSVADDIEVADTVGGAIRIKLYDNVTGLEATNRATDDNHQGAVLWNLGSRPFQTRILKTLRDVVTAENAPWVVATSATGWGGARGRQAAAGGLPEVEGDLLYIHAGQPGAGMLNPGLYEILTVVNPNTAVLRSAAPLSELASLNYPLLDSGLFSYSGTQLLTASVLRRQSGTLLRGTDLETDATGLASSASAALLSNDVQVGDHLTIESGPNLGEYVLDVVERVWPSSLTWLTGTMPITGLSGMTANDVGWYLEITNSDHPGTYKIVSYLSPTSVAIYSPYGTGADSFGPNVNVRYRPRPPYLTDTGGQLRRADGDAALTSVASGQTFRIVRPSLQHGLVYGARTVAGLDVQLEVLDIGLGSIQGVFTPGMVGTFVSVSNSQNPSNDGTFMITQYVDAGHVVIDRPSATSDTGDGQATLYLQVGP